MKKITLRVALFGIISFSFFSCHKDQTYYCYLVEEEWPNEADTISIYGEAFWFYKKTSKPEDECNVAWANLIITNQWNPNYSCNCNCSWEPD